MTRLELHVDISASPETVFDLLADLHGYGRWLPPAPDYAGTSEISSPPVAVGTTYRELSRAGVRHGVVTILDRPRIIAFHQPMTLRPRVAGTIDTTVTLVVEARGDGARVTRTVDLDLPGQLVPVRGIVIGRYRGESERMLWALKTFAEA